jgi:nucleoside-diphosphate-sugar epimerase
MRVLVTGNQGYIGAVLTPVVAAAGHEVWGLDTGYYRDCNFGEVADPAFGVTRQIARDVREVTDDDLRGVAAVIHLAALSNDPTGELAPALTSEINHRASVRLARIARQCGARRFLFASSCSIYGQGEGPSLTEEAPFNPLTAYARSKVDTERDLAALADDGFSPVFLRNATAYGFSPRLRFDLAVNNLAGWAYTTGLVKLLSDGRAWRPFVHVEDIARACVAALAAPRDAIHNQAFNVGQDEDNHRIRDVAEKVAQVVPNSRVSFAEGVSADSRTYHVSFAKLRRQLPEFRPAWSLERGIGQLRDAFAAAELTAEGFQGRTYTRLKQLQHLLSTGRLDSQLQWTAS